jgi:hypothetical protein
MKNTIIMLAFIAALLLTWMSVSFIGWTLSDATFKACTTYGGTLMFMLLVGWIPSVIVVIDLDEYFDNNNKKW